MELKRRSLRNYEEEEEETILRAKLFETSRTLFFSEPRRIPKTRWEPPILPIRLKWSTTLSNTKGWTTTFSILFSAETGSTTCFSADASFSLGLPLSPVDFIDVVLAGGDMSESEFEKKCSRKINTKFFFTRFDCIQRTDWLLSSIETNQSLPL